MDNLEYIVGILGLAIAMSLLIAVYYFGKGHEDAPARENFPFTHKEREFNDKYRHEAVHLHRPRAAGQKAKIFIQHWLPKSEVKGNVVIVHGLNDYSGRNTDAAKSLLDLGFGCYAIDHEGFGRSSGRHGYFESLDDIVDDMLVYLEQIRDKHPNTKLFLFGGSMGGLIICHVILRHKNFKVDGAILQCPAITIHKDSRPAKYVEMISKVLKKYVPKLPLVEGNRGKNNSSAVAETIEAEKLADPLFHSGKLRIGTGLAILEALESIEDRLHEIDVPYLLQHGKADRVCHVSGSAQFHERSLSEDKTFLTYDNAAHDLMREPEEIQKKLKADYMHWLAERQ